MAEVITFPQPARMTGTSHSGAPRMYLRARPNDAVTAIELHAAGRPAAMPESTQAHAMRIARAVRDRVKDMRHLPEFDPTRPPRELAPKRYAGGLFAMPTLIGKRKR